MTITHFLLTNIRKYVKIIFDVKFFLGRYIKWLKKKRKR